MHATSPGELAGGIERCSCGVIYGYTAIELGAFAKGYVVGGEVIGSVDLVVEKPAH